MHNAFIANTAVLSPMMTIMTCSAIVGRGKALMNVKVMCSLIIKSYVRTKNRDTTIYLNLLSNTTIKTSLPSYVAAII